MSCVMGSQGTAHDGVRLAGWDPARTGRDPFRSRMPLALRRFAAGPDRPAGHARLIRTQDPSIVRMSNW